MLQQRLQICARDEDRFFCRRNNQSTQGRIALNEIEMFVQFVEGGGVENIRARIGAIEGKRANAVVTNLAPNHGSCSNCRHWNYLGSSSPDSKRRRNPP